MSPSNPKEGLASNAREGQRIAKLLARAGIASRREIERMIEEGRIALNGTPLTTPATVLTSLAGVTVDGNPVQAAEPARLFRFHKPTGLLTAERDPRGRPTIYDRLPQGLPRVMPVGRLDLNTEGLLLLTTDGELKRRLELPATGVERSYRARAYGEITQEQLEDLIEGIEIEGVRYGSIDANLERRTGTNTWIQMRLKEGKNREVRRVLEHFGLKVSRLIRTSYGPFALRDLPVGAVEEVPPRELTLFLRELDKPGTLPGPGDWTPTAAARPKPAAPIQRRGAGRGKPAEPSEARPQVRSSGRREGGRDAPRADARAKPPVMVEPVPEERKARPKPKPGWAKAKPRSNTPRSGGPKPGRPPRKPRA